MKSRSIVKRDLRNWKLYRAGRRAGQARGRQERVRGRGESAPLAQEILCLPTNYQEPTRENEGYLKARSAEGRDRRTEGRRDGGTALKAPLKKRLDRLEAWMGRPSVRPPIPTSFLSPSLARICQRRMISRSTGRFLGNGKRRRATASVRGSSGRRFVVTFGRSGLRLIHVVLVISLPPPDRPLAPLSHISPSQSIRTNR